jgi:hypothetical protein
VSAPSARFESRWHLLVILTLLSTALTHVLVACSLDCTSQANFPVWPRPAWAGGAPLVAAAEAAEGDPRAAPLNGAFMQATLTPDLMVRSAVRVIVEHASNPHGKRI